MQPPARREPTIGSRPVRWAMGVSLTAIVATMGAHDFETWHEDHAMLAQALAV